MRPLATLSAGLVWLLLVVAAGCGGSDARNLAKAPVAGKISYPDKFPGGEVIFMHDSGEMTVIKFGADGAYTGEVPTGHNKVAVMSKTSSFESSPADKGRTMEMFTYNIPQKYADFATSKLEYDVKDGANSFDIPLAKQ